MESNEQVERSRKRRRPALSCVECRRRKVKCDRNHPCRHCVSAGDQCSYVLQPGLTYQQCSSRTTVSQSSVAAPAPRVNEDNQLAVPTPPTSSLGGDQSSSIAQNTIEQLQDLSTRIKSLEDAGLHGDGTLPTGICNVVGASYSQQSPIRTANTRLQQADYWLSTPKEFSNFLFLFKETAAVSKESWLQAANIRPLMTQATNLLQQCKTLGKKLKYGRPANFSCTSKGDSVYPSRAFADATARLYFDYFESTYRILHAPTFWREYERYWSDPNTAPMDLQLRVLLVLAVGSSLFEQSPEEESKHRELMHQWLNEAQIWLTRGKSCLTIAGIQIQCLAILARQIFCIGDNLVWASVGALVHSAMQINLHRDPKHYKFMTVLQAEIHRRLWTTILELVAQSSLDAGMPPRLTFEDFDTEAPSDATDDELEQSNMTLGQISTGDCPRTTSQRVLHHSLRSRFRVAELLNNPSYEIDYAEVLDLSADLASVCGSVGSISREDTKPCATSFRTNMVDYHLRRSLLYLHTPFSCRASSEPAFYYSRKASVDAALALTRPEPCESFSRLTRISGGMFKDGIRYASAAIALELLSHTETQRTNGTLHRNPEYREMLMQAVDRMSGLAAERLRNEECNVKNHTFLNMVTAQVYAVVKDLDYEESVLQGAIHSLQLCHNILQSRHDLSLNDNDFGRADFYDTSGAGLLDLDDGEFWRDEWLW